jgi:hypothetical protein
MIKEKIVCGRSYYKNKTLQNKMVETFGKNGRTANPKNLFFFKINPAGKRDTGRPQKRRKDQFLI